MLRRLKQTFLFESLLCTSDFYDTKGTPHVNDKYYYHILDQYYNLQILLKLFCTWFYNIRKLHTFLRKVAYICIPVFSEYQITLVYIYLYHSELPTVSVITMQQWPTKLFFLGVSASMPLRENCFYTLKQKKKN